MLILFTSISAFGKKAELFESKYFTFQSNKYLNAHLFLYNKAIGCKFGKKPNDSLAYYSFKDKFGTLDQKEISELNNIIRYYKDSLLSKDLLFDSTMTEFSDLLSEANLPKIKWKLKWQLETMNTLKLFEPYFTKLYWFAIDSTNKAWLNTYKQQIKEMEISFIPALEKIYQTKLPDTKIKVDLSCYATWTGAYSYKNSYCHIIFSSYSKANQGDLAAEVIFHEASHFLVDKLAEQIQIALNGKEVKKSTNLWHNIIFYTTGYEMIKQYKVKWKTFEPYYVQMKFEEKFPDFKVSVDGCKLYWNDYIEGKLTFNAAVKKLVEYQLEKG